MKDNWYIYGIRATSEDSYRYIGYTTSSILDRLKLHIFEARKGEKPYAVYDWIRSKNFEVVAEEVESIVAGDVGLLYDREKHWISFYRNMQGSLLDKITDRYLLNHTDGGGGALGFKHTQEECLRRRGQKGYWLGVTGEDNPNFGRKMTTEQRNKLSASKKGSKPANKGKTASVESRMRMSQAKIGSKASDATRLRMSYSHHVRVHEIKIKDTCKWCLGADLEEEIKKKELELNEYTME